MLPAAFALLLVFLVVFGIGMALLQGRNNHARIERDVARRGGRVESITWEPFARGWFFEKNERAYRVAWVDRRGQRRESLCKTSLWGGVYWTDDQGPDVVSHQELADTVQLLRENDDLRRELERLKRRRDDA